MQDTPKKERHETVREWHRRRKKDKLRQARIAAAILGILLLAGLVLMARGCASPADNSAKPVSFEGG